MGRQSKWLFDSLEPANLVITSTFKYSTSYCANVWRIWNCSSFVEIIMIRPLKYDFFVFTFVLYSIWKKYFSLLTMPPCVSPLLRLRFLFKIDCLVGFNNYEKKYFFKLNLNAHCCIFLILFFFLTYYNQKLDNFSYHCSVKFFLFHFLFSVLYFG